MRFREDLSCFKPVPRLCLDIQNGNQGHRPGGLSRPRARPYDLLRMTVPPGREFLRARPPPSAAGTPALVNVVTDCKARATTVFFTLYST